jgi:hypothetical protein
MIDTAMTTPTCDPCCCASGGRQVLHKPRHSSGRHDGRSGHGRPTPESCYRCCAMVNRMQALVLGFLVLAWTSLLIILATAPEVPTRRSGCRPATAVPQITFLAALWLRRAAGRRGYHSSRNL